MAFLVSFNKKEEISKKFQQFQELFEKMKRKKSSDALLNIASGLQVIAKNPKSGKKLLWHILNLSEYVSAKKSNSVANCIKLLSTFIATQKSELSKIRKELLAQESFEAFYQLLKAEYSAIALKSLGIGRDDLKGVDLEKVDASTLAVLKEVVPKLMITYQKGGFRSGLGLLQQIVIQILKGNFKKWRYTTDASLAQLKSVGLSGAELESWKKNASSSFLIVDKTRFDLKSLGVQIQSNLDQAAADSTFDWQNLIVEELKEEKGRLGKEIGPKMKELGKKIGALKKQMGSGKKRLQELQKNRERTKAQETELQELLKENEAVQQQMNTVLQEKNQNSAKLSRASAMVLVVEAYQTIRDIHFETISMQDINLLPSKIKVLIDRLGGLNSANTILGLPSEEPAKNHLNNILHVIKSLDELKRTSNELIAKDTDDPFVVFKMGMVPTRTCQRYLDGNARYNKCLLASVTDANKKLINVYSGHEVKARALIKITTVNVGRTFKRAILFEKMYSPLIHLNYLRVVIRHILKKAKESNSFIAIPHEKTFLDFGAQNMEAVKKVLREESALVGYEIDFASGSSEIRSVPSNNSFEYADSGMGISHNVIGWEGKSTDSYSVPLWFLKKKKDSKCGVISKRQNVPASLPIEETGEYQEIVRLTEGHLDQIGMLTESGMQHLRVVLEQSEIYKGKHGLINQVINNFNLRTYVAYRKEILSKLPFKRSSELVLFRGPPFAFHEKENEKDLIGLNIAFFEDNYLGLSSEQRSLISLINELHERLHAEGKDEFEVNQEVARFLKQEKMLLDYIEALRQIQNYLDQESAYLAFFESGLNDPKNEWPSSNHLFQLIHEKPLEVSL